VTEPAPGSKGVALTSWLVQKASGLLERKSSRRGFILGSAMVGSAVAVAGCLPAVAPGSPYKHITDCAGGLCNDGYTEFCCTINNGLNACPSGSFAGGWWRADYSSFCNGTRYYIDCMQNCCGPNLGNGFCAGCVECSCGGGCDTRRIYCNYFRYGQCHQEITITGPIACRVVTCTPPYNDASLACTTTLAVDNSTAEHAPAHGCASTTPMPVVGAAAAPGGGQAAVFYRASSGNIAALIFNGAAWTGPNEVVTGVNSALTAAVDATGMYVFGRGSGNALWWSRYANGAWSGQQAFGVVGLNSDPVAVSGSNAIHLFGRSLNNNLWYGHIDSGVWSGWATLLGNWTSDFAATSSSYGVHVFGRTSDNHLSARLLKGGTWGATTSLGGNPSSSPTAVSAPNGVYVFIRNADGSISSRRYTGSWGAWQNLGGSASGEPVAVADGNTVYVFVRAADGRTLANRLVGGSWSGFQQLNASTNASPTAVATTSGVYCFVRGTDQALWYGRYVGGSWSGFQQLGGVVSPSSALYP